MEQYLVGCMFNDADVARRHSDISGNMFENVALARIWEAGKKIVESGMAPDLMNVTDAIGDQYFADCAELQKNHMVSPNVDQYAAAFRKASNLNKAKAVALNAVQQIQTARINDKQDIIGDMVSELLKLNSVESRYEWTIAEAVKECYDYLDRQQNMPAVKIGLTDLDELTFGHYPGDLVVIGARPAMGKTAFLINAFLNQEDPCGLISAEQGVAQIAQRMLAITGKVAAGGFRKIELFEDEDWTNIKSATYRLEKNESVVYDKPSPTLTEIIQIARKWKIERGIKALYVDYLQRIKTDGINRTDVVGKVAEGLKELARELDIPVFVLAQVNRAVEQRNPPSPTPADLKDSGIIEQEADCIMTLYREEVYNKETNRKGVLDVGVGKNRHGQTGGCSVIWKGTTMQVLDMQTQRYEYD